MKMHSNSKRAQRGEYSVLLETEQETRARERIDRALRHCVFGWGTCFSNWFLLTNIFYSHTITLQRARFSLEA